MRNSSIQKIIHQLNRALKSTTLVRIRALSRETLDLTRETRLFTVASSLAYTTILSIIPFLAVSFSIFQAFRGLDKVYATIQPLIIENLAEQSGEAAMNAIKGFIENIHTATLGITGLIGLIITSMSMLSSAEKAINSVWKVEVQRSWFHRIATYWMFITLGPVSLSAAVGAASSANASGWVSLGSGGILPSWLGGFLFVALLFFAVNKWVPCRKVHWIAALSGAVFTAALWGLARFGYSLYVQHILSYNKIYGSLGAVPILLLWIYIVWVIVLMGAALASTLQKRWDLK